VCVCVCVCVCNLVVFDAYGEQTHVYLDVCVCSISVTGIEYSCLLDHLLCVCVFAFVYVRCEDRRNDRTGRVSRWVEMW